MKCVMVMFDTLCRHLLEPYGCRWTHTPNFTRLARRTVTFDTAYVCSMPCMPARRELHTGRPNFLHRSWGPLEPFDDSMPQLLRDGGIHSHLITDHYHYFEDGGCTYHTRYGTWEFFRGQEGDPWIGQVADPAIPPCVAPRSSGNRLWRQDWVNRSHLREEHELPQSRCFEAAGRFLRQNRGEDRWFLQVETFDPHEPFYSPRRYKDLYADHYNRYRASGGLHFDWPPYRRREGLTDEQIEHLRFEYASLLSMCDARLGDVLDWFDELSLWDDTMLIVNTDHGFLLGEREMLGKVWCPMYEEVARTPLFVWDPRSRQVDQRRSSLVQNIDLAPTILDFFGLDRPPDMLGVPLADTIAHDAPVRTAGLFGSYGRPVSVTDGRYVYMRSARADNTPLYEYTLMPTRMSSMFGVEDLRRTVGLAEPFSFTKGLQTLKIDAPGPSWAPADPMMKRDLLFDLHTDPGQLVSIDDPALERRMIGSMVDLMRRYDAPPEQYERLGLVEFC